ncbi:2OG-Fe(II) oxygenase [Sulfuricaulis sp.]|jgi:PKHD-type hydroxylase|uniref:2OG-Fe(II) oxygenase n=1 Tax=Sulfuricaulis sp. TaxID=2003553 RepID=UPI0035596421
MTSDATTAQSGQAQQRNDSVTMITTVENWFSTEECERVIAFGGFTQEKQGTVGAERAVSNARSSQIRFIPPGEQSAWIYQKIESTLAHMNKAYRYHLTGIELIQVARYDVGCYYNWHMDLGPNNNSLRKLSLSVQLSNAEDYEGGDLEFMNSTPPYHRGRGTLIVFPSFLTHRVTAVTSGARLSLVAWVTGNPFS